MNPTKPDTTKLDPTAAWPFGAVEPVTEADMDAEFVKNAEESPL